MTNKKLTIEQELTKAMQLNLANSLLILGKLHGYKKVAKIASKLIKLDSGILAALSTGAEECSFEQAD